MPTIYWRKCCIIMSSCLYSHILNIVMSWDTVSCINNAIQPIHDYTLKLCSCTVWWEDRRASEHHHLPFRKWKCTTCQMTQLCSPQLIKCSLWQQFKSLTIYSLTLYKYLQMSTRQHDLVHGEENSDKDIQRTPKRKVKQASPLWQLLVMCILW